MLLYFQKMVILARNKPLSKPVNSDRLYDQTLRKLKAYLQSKNQLTDDFLYWFCITKNKCIKLGYCVIII